MTCSNNCTKFAVKIYINILIQQNKDMSIGYNYSNNKQRITENESKTNIVNYSKHGKNWSKGNTNHIKCVECDMQQ